MKLLTKSISITFISLSIMFLFVTPTKAMQTMKLRNEMKRLGISETVSEKLIRKINNNELLDSMNPKYDYVKPAQTIKTDKLLQEKYVYPDGSLKIVTVEKLASISLPGKISGGSYNSGGYWYTWNNASVSAIYLFVNFAFKANFEGATGVGKISKVYDKSIITGGGTFSNAKLGINRKDASNGKPAYATLEADVSVTQGFGAATLKLRLYVTNNGQHYAKFFS